VCEGESLGDETTVNPGCFGGVIKGRPLYEAKHIFTNLKKFASHIEDKKHTTRTTN